MERRRHPRAIVNWPAVVILPRESLEGEVKDISVGGACILCPEKPGIEDSLSILLKPSEQRSISTVGEKVWSDTFDIGYGTMFGIGIRFIYISPADRKYIANVIEEVQRE